MEVLLSGIAMVMCGVCENDISKRMVREVALPNTGWIHPAVVQWSEARRCNALTGRWSWLVSPRATSSRLVYEVAVVTRRYMKLGMTHHVRTHPLVSMRWQATYIVHHADRGKLPESKMYNSFWPFTAPHGGVGGWR